MLRATSTLSILLLATGTPAAANAAERPPLPEAAAGCERFVGTSSGNDPSVRLVLLLCERDDVSADGEDFGGQVQWSSLRSGWSLRDVAGRRIEGGIELHDVRIVEQAPEPGWHFCTVDVWDLQANGDRLDGTYRSAACRDSAEVHLTRMTEDAAPGDPSVGETPPPPPSLPPSGDSPPVEGTPPSAPPSQRPSETRGDLPAPPPTRGDGGCGCAITPGEGRGASRTKPWGATGAPWILLGSGVAAAALLRRSSRK